MPLERRRVNVGRKASIDLSGAFGDQLDGGFDEEGNFTKAAAKHPILDAMFNHGQNSQDATALNTKYGFDILGDKQALNRIAVEAKLHDALADKENAFKAQLADKDNAFKLGQSDHNLENVLKEKQGGFDIEDKHNDALKDKMISGIAKALTRAQGNNAEDPLAYNLNSRDTEDDFALNDLSKLQASTGVNKATSEKARNEELGAVYSRVNLPRQTVSTQNKLIAENEGATDTAQRKTNFDEKNPELFDQSYRDELAKQGFTNKHTKALIDYLGTEKTKWLPFGGNGALFNPHANTILTPTLDDSGNMRPVVIDAQSGEPIIRGSKNSSIIKKEVPASQSYTTIKQQQPEPVSQIDADGNVSYPDYYGSDDEFMKGKPYNPSIGTIKKSKWNK